MYLTGILHYIERHNPVVIVLNVNQLIPEDVIDAYIVSNDAKALSDKYKYVSIQNKVILPKSRLRNILGDRIDDKKILDFGLEIGGETFEIHDTGVKIPWTLSPPYAFSVCIQANAKSISLVGFDGYDAGNPLQKTMNEVFLKYEKISTCIPITSLTPTSYSIRQRSIYEPKKKI